MGLSMAAIRLLRFAFMVLAPIWGVVCLCVQMFLGLVGLIRVKLLFGDFIGGKPVHGDGVDVTQCYEWAS